MLVYQKFLIKHFCADAQTLLLPEE